MAVACSGYPLKLLTLNVPSQESTLDGKTGTDLFGSQSGFDTFLKMCELCENNVLSLAFFMILAFLEHA